MGKPWLEGFKFATYLAVPIALTVTFAFNPDNLNGIIRDVRVSFESGATRRATRDARARDVD